MEDINNYQGLNNQQVLEAAQKYGLNELKAKKESPLFIRFIKQFKDPMCLLLIAIIIIGYSLAIYHVITNKESNMIESVSIWIEPSVILLIAILNAGLGVFQENKAINAMKSLQKCSESRAKVIRNGKLELINAKDVVVGDLISFESGDVIPADARLISLSNLSCVESILNGEATPITKSLKPDIKQSYLNQPNMVFSGTNCTSGKGVAEVVSIGMNTEIGKIANLINNQKTVITPLQYKINKLSKVIALIALCVCVLQFFVYIVVSSNGGFNIADNWQKGLMSSVILMVGAIPEGASAIVTILLAISVQKMSKKHALIKKIPAVETLGSANVICSDKTGTLTQNKMTIVKTHVVLKKFSEQEMISYATLCTDATIETIDNKTVRIGDPTELCFLDKISDYNLNKSTILKEYKKIADFPFDSDRKLMTVVYEPKNINDKYLVVTKGSIDSLFNIIKNKGVINEISDINKIWSDGALRVLGIGYKLIDKNSLLDQSNIENDLNLIGIVGIVDPIRPEAKTAIEECLKASIMPVMITGDHLNTACAIAKQLGILSGNKYGITGVDLEKMNDDELDSKIDKIAVYARVSPSDKIRIVKSWQKRDMVVAMTGDGVNDAPALKAANIGCAMGITGTDVSKDAADMILTDDNFKTIVEAVKQGREVMKNIKAILCALLIGSFASLFTMFFGTIIFSTSTLNSLQLLWINIIGETCPGIAMSVNRYRGDLMNEKPQNLKDPILSVKLWIKIVLFALGIAFVGLLFFFIGASSFYNFDFAALRNNINYLNTNQISDISNKLLIQNAINFGSCLNFISLGLCVSVLCVSLRTNQFIFKEKIKDMKYVLLAFLANLFLILFVAYTPYISIIFNMNPLFSKVYDYQNPSISSSPLLWLHSLIIIPPTIILLLLEMSKIKYVKKN